MAFWLVSFLPLLLSIVYFLHSSYCDLFKCRQIKSFLCSEFSGVKVKSFNCSIWSSYMIWLCAFLLISSLSPLLPLLCVRFLYCSLNTPVMLASGPLLLLFPLTGTFFPQMSIELIPYFLQVSVQVLPFQEGLPWPPCIKWCHYPQPWSSPTSLLCLIFFFFLSTYLPSNNIIYYSVMHLLPISLHRIWVMTLLSTAVFLHLE